MVCRGKLCALALTVAGVASSAFAIVPPTKSRNRLPAEVVLRPELQTGDAKAAAISALGSKIDLQVDRRSGAVRLLTAKSFRGVPTIRSSAAIAQYQQTIDSFVSKSLPILGVEMRDLQAVKAATYSDKDVTFFDFNVMRDGLEILDANVAFRFKAGQLVQIQTQTMAEAKSDQRPRLANLDARVRKTTGASELKYQREAYRAVPAKNGYRLVRVTLFAAVINDEIYDVQAASATGKVIQAVPRRHYIDGQATAVVYPRTWFNGAQVMRPLSQATLTVGASTLTTGADGSFSTQQPPRLNGFKGPYFYVRPSTGIKVVKDAIARDAFYELTVSGTEEKNLSQNMAFYHLNAINQYARKYIRANWLDNQLDAYVNIGRTCNAFWDGDSVNFFSAGGGCANTALVSDIVYHEWGHGLDANTGGIVDGAYSEGFGDIVSMIMNRAADLAPGFYKSGGSIRNLEPNKIYPRDRGEVHAEGLIIGGTFWDLYQALKVKYDDDQAIDLVSRYAFKTIFTARRYTDVYNALLVVDDDDSDLTNKTPNYCEINTAFAAHGLATANADCN